MIIIESLRNRITRIIERNEREGLRGEPVLGGLPQKYKDMLDTVDPSKQNPYDLLHEISIGLQQDGMPRPNPLDCKDMLDRMERAIIARSRLKVIEGGKQ